MGQKERREDLSLIAFILHPSSPPVYAFLAKLYFFHSQRQLTIFSSEEFVFWFCFFFSHRSLEAPMLSLAKLPAESEQLSRLRSDPCFFSSGFPSVEAACCLLRKVCVTVHTVHVFAQEWHSLSCVTLNLVKQQPATPKRLQLMLLFEVVILSAKANQYRLWVG